MSRHLWNTGSETGSENPPSSEPPPPHLGIFAATLEESTIELPRYADVEPAEPALSMLSRGRHGTW